MHPLQSAQTMNFILQMKRKALTWKKLNFWDQVLFAPPILGTMSTCFEIVTERTGQIQGQTCVLQVVVGSVVPALANTLQKSSTRYSVPPPKGFHSAGTLLQADNQITPESQRIRQR